VTTVHREPFVAILPSWHSLSAKKEIRLRELKGNPFVMYAREYAPGFRDLLAGILSNAGVVPKVVQTAGEMPTLICLVDAGVGVSIVPVSVAKQSSPRWPCARLRIECRSPRLAWPSHVITLQQLYADFVNSLGRS
jgi:DNA-binding transcriptional LysR family regulator